MVRKYLYLMVKRSSKGFTLVEVILVMLVVVTLGVLFGIIAPAKQYYFKSPHICQLKAMSTRRACHYSKDIWFNDNGNINQGRTIKIDRYTCVFQLGMGRYRCE